MSFAPHIARTIARLSAEEIGSAVAAAAPARFGRVVHAAAALAARRPSARLGDLLARFDARIAAVGISAASREIVESFGARVRTDGACPTQGPVLLVANHPGAYDALSILAGLGRDDVAIIAADRPFLRALPNLAAHLVFVAEPVGANARARARAVCRALEWVASGRVAIQFGAGAIEPDARFDHDVLGTWGDGTGLLAARATRHGAPVVPTFVSGVHSPRAKRLPFVRWAERRGITTIAPLVQATLPGFRDVVVSVRVGDPVAPAAVQAAENDRERTVLLRNAVAALAQR
jgi:hypothetical protein